IGRSPGEPANVLAERERFLSLARLAAIGIFGYADQEGTEAASLPGHLDPADVARRADELSDIAEEVMAQRAADRVGETVDVLIEEDLGGHRYEGRAAHQAPEVDGVTTVASPVPLAAGEMVSARVTGSEGVDLTADPLAAAPRPGQTR